MVLRFTLPAADDKVAKDIEDLATDFDLCAITNKLGGCTSFTNGVLQCSRKILVTMKSIA